MRRASFVMATLGSAAVWIALGVWLPWWLIAAAAAAAAIWLAATPAGRRTGSITAAAIATLPQRLGGASVALVGIAGVVGVLVGLLAMGNGFRVTLQDTGTDDTAIVLAAGTVPHRPAGAHRRQGRDTGAPSRRGVRERIPELAVLKTIGFPARNILLLVLAESVLLLALGGIAGLALADAVVGVVHTLKGPHLPMAPIDWAIWLRGLGLMALVGLIVGVMPALRAMRLRVVDALAGW